MINGIYFFYHIKGHFDPAPLVNLRLGPMKDAIQASSVIEIINI